MSDGNPLSMNENLIARDLDHVISCAAGELEELRGRRIFISGGTGFFGSWLLETFAWANSRLDLGASAVVLTRNSDTFARKAPHLAACPAIQFVPGDVRTFDFPSGDFHYVIHAATDANAQAALDYPLDTLDIIVSGTRRMLDFARHCGAAKFLLTSSGAIYGKQPSDLTHIPEDFAGSPDPADARSSYGESKRLAELLCVLYGSGGLECKIARCFAFSGPYLPLDGLFAIGNFVRDALEGKTIRVRGDGTPYRSYLYAADLAVWLWTILFRGRNGRPYNVGSEDDVAIAELAAETAAALGSAGGIEIAVKAVPGVPPLRYVPSTVRARTELGLNQHISLREGIVRMAQWHRARDAARSGAAR